MQPIEQWTCNRCRGRGQPAVRKLHERVEITIVDLTKGAVDT